MKFFTWISSIVVILFIGIYILAFTSFGNSILKPIVEAKIQIATNTKAKLNTFSISIDKLNIVLELDSSNIIYANGNYSLFSKTFNIAYRLKLDKLENLNKFTKNDDIKGKLYTEGYIKGDIKFITIDGISDVANSNTSYHVELTELNPTSIIAKVKKANLAKLLSLGGQKRYADADVDIDINFKNIKPNELDGDITLVTQKGKINTKVMKNDFNITIPKTTFTMNLDAKLLGKSINYKYELKSNLANFASNGKVIPKPLKTNIKYDLDVEELAVLKPITNANIRGALKLNGTVNGNKEKMLVYGKSDLASSKTSFEAVLKDFELASIKAKIKDLKLEKLLYMTKQPHYADALFSFDIDISNAKVGQLDGKILSIIKNGVVDSKLITKEYKFKYYMPKTVFRARTFTKLDGNIINSKIDFDSNLANLDIKNAKFNLKDNSFISDYLVNIAKLDKLFFVTEQHIRGGLKVDGTLQQAKDLDFTAYTKVAGGEIKTKLHNDDLKVELKDVKTLELLHKLIYPEIFMASLNAKIGYDLATKKGKMLGNLNDGKFTRNSVFDLARQYAKIDMYKEIFKGDVKADINKENILASLDLVSRTSSIKTQNTKLNTKTNNIDSTINIDANHNLITVKLSGKTTKPNVKVEADELIKSQAKKAIVKKLGDKLGGDVGNLLNSFFR